jgi:hypothetical protein
MGRWIQKIPGLFVCVRSPNGKGAGLQNQMMRVRIPPYALDAHVAQLVVHWFRKSGVAGSIPVVGLML